MSIRTKQKLTGFVNIGSGQNLIGTIDTKVKLVGNPHLSSDVPIYNGGLNAGDKQKLKGTVNVGTGKDLKGSIGTKGTLIGHTHVSPELPIYNGEHTVIPSTSDVTVLQTAQKAMNSNITIEKIPYAEVSNTSGGYTVTIGGN